MTQISYVVKQCSVAMIVLVILGSVPVVQANASNTKEQTQKELRAKEIQKMKQRCRKTMGSFGASLVKVCLDEEIKAYDALQKYPKKHDKIIDRCRDQMLETVGWSIVKVCADEDIRAEEELKKY